MVFNTVSVKFAQVHGLGFYLNPNGLVQSLLCGFLVSIIAMWISKSICKSMKMPRSDPLC
jgi:hypothetical protein